MKKTRFSPSPTGLIHLGNVRAALFSALYAKHAHGVFILRIEDTDATRSEEQFAELLQEDLRWLGIHWQEGPGVGGGNGPYSQSQRHEIYNRFYQQIESQQLAYPCFCTDQELALNRKLQLARGQAPKYPGTCRHLTSADIQERLDKGLKPALRFRVPENETIEFVDTVKGLQKFLSDDIGDFIIRRADGSSSFMFCNAVDDSLMGVTHVIRGEDHLTNTPRQLMILKALQMRAPDYGHLSLILGDDGAPLSKRHGSFSLHDLREQGFLPIAVLNYLARLSHAYDENKLLCFDELASRFNLEKLSKSAARFDKNQLLHWQKEAVLALSAEDTWHWLGDDLRLHVPAAVRDSFIEMMRQNIVLPSEARHWFNVFFGDKLEFDGDQLSVLKEAGIKFFETALQALSQYVDDLKPCLDQIKSKLNVSGKHLFMPLRIALTGEKHGPDLPQIAMLLKSPGMELRIKQVIEHVFKDECETSMARSR